MRSESVQARGTGLPRSGIDNDDRRINEDNCTLNDLKDDVTRQISRVAIIDTQLLAR